MAAQITAVIIFLIMFALIITEKIPRHIATTICSIATIILVFGVCMHSATALWDTLNFQTLHLLISGARGRKRQKAQKESTGRPSFSSLV